MDINTSSGVEKAPSRRIWRRITSLLRLMWQDSKSIVKFAWSEKKNVSIQIGIFGIVILPLITASLLARTIPRELSYCSPGGDFSLDSEYNPWSVSQMFQITMGVGRLTFSQAKLIDVIWDVVVGRGGQSILAIVSFKVFTKALTRLLEERRSSVSYSMFEAVVFQGASLSSIWKMGSTVCRKLTGREIAAFIWMAVASVYLLSFPTLLSAMTGYTTHVSPYFNTTEGIKISWSNVTMPQAAYIITDGDRIRLTSPYIVGNGGYSNDKGKEWDYRTCAQTAYSVEDINTLPPRCQIAVYTSECELISAALTLYDR